MTVREPSPRPGDTPGYPEKHPGDKGEAQQPDPRKPPNPDEGGLDREPDQDGNTADT